MPSVIKTAYDIPAMISGEQSLKRLPQIIFEATTSTSCAEINSYLNRKS